MSQETRAEADPARLVAFSVLLGRERKSPPPADELLDRKLERASPPLGNRDREFATNLVYTTIRYLLTIDETIRVLGGRSVGDLDPHARTLLRLGTCQLLFSRSVPEWAAVDSTVDLARRVGKASVSGLMNAILRNVVRARSGGQTVNADTTTPEGLAIATSHPEWMARRVIGLFGLERGRRFLEFDNEVPTLALRVNLAKTTRERALERLRVAGVQAERSQWVPEGIRLVSSAHPPGLPGFDIGWVSVQDEAAQIVSHVVAPRSGDRILDLCAGLGGKTLHIAALLRVAGGGGRVVAVDSSPGKLKRLREMAGRLGGSNVKILAADGRDGAALREGCFDRVLVDAPCSDLGSLRRHPDAKWRRCEEDIERLSGLQGELLESASRLLRPGGRLVYSTCTITEEENDRTVGRFLEGNPGFRREDPRPDLPEPCRCLVGDDLAIRTYPNMGQMDGFFAIRLRKVEEGRNE